MELCKIRSTTQCLVSRTGAGRQGYIFSFQSREKNVLDFSSYRPDHSTQNPRACHSECYGDFATVNAVGSATGPNTRAELFLHRIGGDMHSVEVVVGWPGGYIQPEVVLYCLRRLGYAAAWARTRWLCYWDACKDGRALLQL